MGIFSNGNGKEPRLPQLPAQPPRSEAVAAWLGEHEKLEHECAFLRDDNARLSNGLKVANEHIIMLKDELNAVRDQLDYIVRHNGSIMTSLDNIETLIIAAKKKARAEAYAPPGSGSDTTSERTAEAQEKIDEAAAKLAAQLAPEGTYTDVDGISGRVIGGTNA